eukprot:COSAG06_NODE_6189_length_3058_cov_11.418723_4_plen_55_part_00
MSSVEESESLASLASMVEAAVDVSSCCCHIYCVAVAGCGTTRIAITWESQPAIR